MKENRLAVLGIELAYIEWGAQDAPLLVCFHGWLDNAASFFPLAKELETDFRLLCVDLPGHGNSDFLPGPTGYALTDGILWIEGVRRALRLESLNLLCHSLGAVLAGLYAASFPERCQKLISIEALGPIPESEEGVAKRLRQHIEANFQATEKQPKRHPNWESCIAARRRGSDLSLAAAELLAQRSVRQDAEGYYWHFDRKLLLPSATRMAESQAKQLLQQIQCPYHLILADQGLDILRQAVALRSAYLPKLHLHHFSGGHHVHMEQSQDIANKIREIMA